VLKDAVATPCHNYCKDCFERLISAAMEDESRWPPRCCLNEIPAKTVTKNISSALQKKYKAKDEEFKVPMDARVYCSTPDCGLFIKRDLMSIATRTARCSRGHKMCLICRQAAHPDDSECPQDRDRQLTDELAQLEGWRRCYRCKRLIEHRDACQHMTCPCSAEFCYVCGARWQTCACTAEDLRRYKARAESRSAAHRQRELQEDLELQKALRDVAEYEREEALKAQMLREELERVAAERRAMEAEHRRRREAARQAAMEVKHTELDELLTDLNSLQHTVLLYDQDRAQEEGQAKAAKAQKEFADHKKDVLAKLQTAVAAKLAAVEAEWAREHQLRVITERQLEKEYRYQLEKHWEGRPDSDANTRRALRAYMLRNDQRFLDYNQWRAEEWDKFNYRLGDELCIEEELLESARARLAEQLASEALELRKRLKAERRWFELVTQERMRLLIQSKEEDRRTVYESVSGDSSDDDDEFFDFDGNGHGSQARAGEPGVRLHGWISA
jgi:hypothetical protein